MCSVRNKFSCFYCPQRSCGKVIFYTCLSVILFTGGGGIPACTGADTPLRKAATAADGTHPTGMHSCFTTSNANKFCAHHLL